jgi:hypothetical protein
MMDTTERHLLDSPTMPKEDRRFATVGLIGLTALSLLLGGMLFFARQDLGIAEREAASLQSSLRAEREAVEELETETADLEETADAAQTQAASLRAVAARCLTEVLRATNASLKFRYGDALFWLRESRRTCRPIMEDGGGGLL